jgi:NADPH-dependent 2,4-dienoyl-CoA reductase/sulfur reductase-like enzyme
VGLIDLQPRAGGQVWRHDLRRGSPRGARTRIAAVEHAGVEFHCGCQVIDGDGKEVLMESRSGATHVGFDTLILATGARELLLPFPGWTLPGVSGAGGLQALSKQGWPVAGKRVVVVGSGPLLLAAAATLRAHGARLLGIFEQASPRAVAAFARQLWRWPARAAQAARLRWQLRGVGYHCGRVIRAAHGDDALRLIEVESESGRVERIDCELLAVGYGLVPNVELAAMLGCALEPWGAHPRVRVDSLQTASVPGVYAVGEACGIGGLQPALLEGAIATHAALGHTRRAEALLLCRDRARHYAATVIATFALGARARSRRPTLSSAAARTYHWPRSRSSPKPEPRSSPRAAAWAPARAASAVRLWRSSAACKRICPDYPCFPRGWTPWVRHRHSIPTEPSYE